MLNKVNRLFVLSFENKDVRMSYSKYYMPTVEIKDHTMLTDNKSFFDIPIKNKEEAYEKTMEMSKNNYYTTGNLLDQVYFSKHYRLAKIGFSKQIESDNTDTTQQINFIGRLNSDDGATMFFYYQENRKNNFNYSQNFASIM